MSKGENTAATIYERDGIGDAHDSTAAKTKVAIIGSGLAGLHAAHLLSEKAEVRARFEVHLFEASGQIGLDGSSIAVDDVRIDVPLRSFNAGYYPNLTRLYQELGVSIRKANFTFSFATYPQRTSPFFLYNGHSGLRGVSIPSTHHLCNSFATLVSHLQLLVIFISSYLCLLVLALYHSMVGHLQDPSHTLSSEPFSVWLSRQSTLIKPIFVESILIPLFSAMTTSSTGQVYQLPTAEVLLYISATFLQSHYTVTNGVREAQSRLICNIPAENVHLATPVHKVAAVGRTSTILSLNGDEKARRYDGFHHVVFATPANLSASLLQTYQESLALSHQKKALKEELHRIHQVGSQLQQVCYNQSTVINHTDISLLPKNKQDWRDLNLVLPHTTNRDVPASIAPSGKGKSADYTMATHLCHCDKSGKYVFQTTNPVISPIPHSILSSSSFSRALTPSKAQLHGLFEWKRKERGARWLNDKWEMHLGHLHCKSHGDFPSLWFCGSYSQGIPLLEGCITSSSLVVSAIKQQQQ